MEGRGGQPWSCCHRQTLDAIRYVSDKGIEWRAMLCGFPAWDRVYAFLRRWRRSGPAKEFHNRLRGRVRPAEGCRRTPTRGHLPGSRPVGRRDVGV
ncbi:transposase [Streptomyces sp. NPDC079020]|uniref:transposase n=1 Tax=Streptomyces sp. NPDC079020 TaxID=3365722 RepID=UPI0037D1E75D